MTSPVYCALQDFITTIEISEYRYFLVYKRKLHHVRNFGRHFRSIIILMLLAGLCVGCRSISSPTASKIEVYPSTINLRVGDEQEILIRTVGDLHGDFDATSITVTSSQPMIATAVENIVLALAPGTAIFTVEAGDSATTISVVVEPIDEQTILQSKLATDLNIGTIDYEQYLLYKL